VERLGESELLLSPLSPRAEALVVAHHGSRSGTSAEFLDRVRPRVAVVSCGYRNRFGHPHPAVCRRVREAGAELWRTDLDGMLRLEARDGRWRVSATRR
jgi:competence protein ComEC